MKFLFFIAILLITACSSSIPTLNQYLLRSDRSSQFAVEKQTKVVGLGVVVVAPYIDGLGLVLETRAGEVRPARDHQWAEPLRDSLRAFIAQEMSAQAGQIIRSNNSGERDWQRRIDLRIDQLHGTANGEARLVAYWVVIDTDERTVISENGFSETKALSANGYSALVAAEKALLQALAIAMAATL